MFRVMQSWRCRPLWRWKSCETRLTLDEMRKVRAIFKKLNSKNLISGLSTYMYRLTHDRKYAILSDLVAVVIYCRKMCVNVEMAGVAELAKGTSRASPERVSY